MADVAAIQGDALEVEKFHEVSKENCSVLQHLICNVDDKNVGLYKLGPFVDVSRAEEFANIRDAYPSTNRKILLEDASSFNGWGHWGSHTPTKSWPSKDKNFLSWVNRMLSSEAIKAKWKELRIYEAILTCTYPLTYDPVLMTSLVCFWNTVTNSFYFPEGMMSITIEDVMALLNASPTEVPLDPLTCGNKKTSYALPKDRRNKEIASYSKFFELEKKNSSVISKQEEVAFYLYWLSKYIVCTRSVQLQKSLISLAETIQEADKPVALAPFILGLIYHSLNSSVRRDFSPGVTGPLWIVQLWAYAYFPDVALLPLPREGTAICYGAYYIQHQPKKADRDFRGCINQLLSRRERTAIEWMPWCKREFGADWFKNFVDRTDLSEEHKAFWQSILTPRDLVVYCTSADIFLELYSPNQWARQLGHTQCIPIPFFRTMNRPWEMRERVRDNQLQYAAIILQDISQNATFHRIMWAPNEVQEFLKWWTKCFGKILQKIPDNLDILAQHFVGLEQLEAPEKVQTLKRKVQVPKEQERPRKKKGRKSSVAVLIEESEKLQSLKTKLRVPKSEDLPSKKKGKKIIVLALTNDAEKMQSSKRKGRPPGGAHTPSEKRGKAVLDEGPTNEAKKSNRLKRKVPVPERHDPPSKKRGKRTSVGQLISEPEPSVEDSPIPATGITIQEHALAPADSPVPETRRRRRKSTQEQVTKPLLQTSSSQEQDPSILRATGVVQEHAVAPAESPIPVTRKTRRKSSQAQAQAPKPLLQRHEDIEKEVEKQPMAQDAGIEEDEEGAESIANMILQYRRNGEIRSKQPHTSPQQATITSNEDEESQALIPPAMESTPQEKGAEENVEQGNASSLQHAPTHPSTASKGDLPTEDADSQLHDPSHVEAHESREQQLQLDAPDHLEHNAKEGLSFPMEVNKDQTSIVEEQRGSSAFVVTTEGSASKDLIPLPQTTSIDEEAIATRVLSPCTSGPHNFQNRVDIDSHSTEVIQAVLKLKELLQKNVEIICTTSDISTLCALLSELASKSHNIVQMKYLRTAALVIKELRKSVPKLLSYLNSSVHTEQEKLEQEIKELESILTAERGNENACKAEIQQVDKEIEALILRKVELETRNEFQQAYISAHQRELEEKQSKYDRLQSDQGYSSSFEANVELSSSRAKWSAVSTGLLEYL